MAIVIILQWSLILETVAIPRESSEAKGQSYYPKANPLFKLLIS